MKIVFLCRLFHPHIGGVEKHVMEIGKRFTRQGDSVTIITEQVVDTHEKEEVKDGIIIYRIPVGKENWLKKFRIWRALWQQRKVMQDADIVHCHDVFFWYLPFRLIYFKKPVYTTFHGYETKFPPTWKAILIRKMSEKLSRGNICIGDFIQKWYGTKPSFVSYGGVDIVSPKGTSFIEVAQSPKSKVQSFKSKPKIIFIGRLEKDTGIPVYLQALDILKKKKIVFTFDAYGDGSYRKEVEKIGNAHGFVEDIDAIISRADIIFVSSYLSILQALAGKKIVIAVYDNPLKKDYLLMTPFAKWIFTTDDPKKLAEKMLFFRNHTEEKTTHAYVWVRQQGWDEVSTIYKKLWRL